MYNNISVIYNIYDGKIGMVAWEIFLLPAGNLTNGEWFWPFEPFSKLKATFCKYWALIQIKIVMNCVYKEYEVKIKWYRTKDSS